MEDGALPLPEEQAGTAGEPSKSAASLLPPPPPPILFLSPPPFLVFRRVHSRKRALACDSEWLWVNDQELQRLVKTCALKRIVDYVDL
jgi:hypothetical protein